MMILDDDGIAAPGEILRPYDIYINKQSPIDTRTPKTGSAANLPDSAYRSNAQSFNDNEGEVVDRLMFFGVFHRIWNHEEVTLLNSFDNHDFPDKGISKLCLVNELDDSLFLAASSDGNIWIWKDYTLKGKQKLVTAFSSIHGHKPGVRSLNAVVDWQQQCGYLCLSVGKPHLCMMWFVLVILMIALVILA
ncbi:Regulatory-associated protein of TOR 1 [Glycine soja]